ATVAHADLRSGAGEGDAVHAGCVFDHVPLLSVGTRALLAREQLAADRAAVAREPDAAERGGDGRGKAPVSGAAIGAGSEALSFRACRRRARQPRPSPPSPRRPAAAASASFAFPASISTN